MYGGFPTTTSYWPFLRIEPQHAEILCHVREVRRHLVDRELGAQVEFLLRQSVQKGIAGR